MTDAENAALQEIIQEIAERKSYIMLGVQDDEYYLGEWHGLIFVEELLKKKGLVKC